MEFPNSIIALWFELIDSWFKPIDPLFSFIDLLIKSKDFSRDEKKQLQEIVGLSSEVFYDNQYYRVVKISSESETMVPINEYKLTESDCSDKIIRLRQGDVVEFK